MPQRKETGPTIERRYLSNRAEVRAGSSEGGERKISGYAAKFNTRSEPMGDWFEEISPKAFNRALKNNVDCRALFNHDPNFILGRTKSSTLRLSVDSTGLRYEVTPPNVEWANSLITSMSRGDVDQASFAFVATDEDWRVEKDGTVVRTLLDVDLYDVSVVTYGAYSSATSQVRSRMPREIRQHIAKRAGKAPEKRWNSFLSSVSSTPWAMLPSKLAVIQELFNRRSNGHSPSKEEIRAAVEMQHGDTPSANGVAVIPVYGSIAQRMGMFDDFSGGTSCEAITKSLRAALADESVKTIVLDIDSPGGTVTGVPELAAEILAARARKPIIAVSNGMAASAAYWIASSASRLVCIPSGEVGSIGVFTMHQDVSGMLDREGVKVTIIKAGANKAEGNPYEPLSDDTKADIQDGVDKFYQMFTAAVAKGRGVSQSTAKSASFGQGRMLMANDALAAGMIDEVATLDQVLRRYSSDGQVSTRSRKFTAAPIRTDDDTDECECDCSACADDGDCEGCTDSDCDDGGCLSAGCHTQSRAMHAALLARRMRDI